MKRPETRYARSGDVAIAYQVAGEGPLDVVFVPGTPTTIESFWDDHTGPFFSRLASFCRLIPFDKRGTGLSDRTAGIPDLETRMDDVRAVLDAVGAERAAIVGASDGGPLSIVFAATYPERAQALVLYGSAPRFTRTTDFPFGPTPEEWRRMTADEVERWATIELARDWLGPQ